MIIIITLDERKKKEAGQRHERYRLEPLWETRLAFDEDKKGGGTTTAAREFSAQLFSL